MNSPRRAALSVLAASSLLMPSIVLADDQPLPVEIKISPRVGRVQDVVATVTEAGQPIVFVKSDTPNEPWWVQNVPRASGPKQYSVKLIFGNEKTPPGSKFHVVGMLLNNANANQYRVGQQLAELPGLPTSSRLIVTTHGGTESPGIETVPMSSSSHVENEIVPAKVAKASVTKVVAAATVAPRAAVVEEDRVTQGADDIVSIATPKPESSVRRVIDIAGKVAEGHTPVVIVRPLTSEKLWWVQLKPTLADDLTFKGKIVFGNEQTADGTRFRVSVLAFEDADAADALKVGSSLKALPKGVAVSSEVTVTLRTAKVEAKRPLPPVQPKTADSVKEKS